ncbi:hypothetical protein CMV_027340 [Castanea mollissima]|uniref:Uncharacterized protein n=1 Tax=Castanea mollissima TaxID=60419 RepID=A0A8J4QJW3_9ROSI|nr:hypothetical protein CMV_027340 [Castanea mollissima]
MAQCINNSSILYEDLADSDDQPESKILNFFAMEGEDQTFKKLDSIHGGKSHCYQDIEDPNQTITELSINNRTLYENLGDLCHDLYHSTAEGRFDFFASEEIKPHDSICIFKTNE